MKHSEQRTAASNRRVVRLRALGAVCAAACAVSPFALGAADLGVADGVVVKFGQGAQLVVRDSVSVGSGVVLTSERDDASGGQSGHGPQVPAAGDWLGLRIEKSASASSALLFDDLRVRYGGGADGAAIALRGVSPTFRYLQVADSTTGLLLRDGASPALTGSSFLRNTIGLDAAGNSAPTIGSTQFVGHRDYAVINRSTGSTLQATGNWWGHATGPRDPAANSAGQGDRVSAGVGYGNFLTAVPLINPRVRLLAPAAYFEQGRIAMEVACINATEYRLAENGAFANVAFQPLPNGRATVEFTPSAGDGRKAIAVQFRDPSGALASATLDGGVLIDTLAPTVALTNPAAGSLIRDPITIEATASDVSGIKHVAFFQGEQLLATDTSAPYSAAWNTDAVADGTYSLKALATDEAGRQAEQLVSVTVSHSAPVPDVDGPELRDVTIDGAALANGAVLSANAAIALKASDRSSVSRVELLLDGAIAAVATSAGSGRYTATVDIATVSNGGHTLSLRAVDSLGNATTQDYSVTVAHAAPAAPTLEAPANNSTTRSANTTVTGRAAVGARVQAVLNGVVSGDPVDAGSDGRFSLPLTLSPGLNEIQATATSSHGTSALSAPVRVTLDVTVPASPANLVASVSNAKVRLTWTASSDPNTVAHDIYRSATEFASIAEAQKLVSVSKSATSYEDAPASDGTYVYRVVAVNAAGTPSVPTASATARLDRTGPHAVGIRYEPRGAHSSADGGTYGQGPIDVKLTVSEPLAGTPYMSVVPDGGMPIPVDLIKRDDTQYEGVLTLGPGIGAGVANVLFSARDALGNRGTEVREGATLRIDTRGPIVEGITLDPAAPIKADASRVVRAVFAFDEDVPADKAPAFQYRLSGSARTAVTLPAPERLDARRWQAQFELPADAGQAAVEVLSFNVVALDALGNSSSQIKAANEFQVYQGDLPALEVPLGLKAVALSGGRVQLDWQAVDGAAAYQLFRQAPGESERAPLSRVATASTIDTTPVDGQYVYSVASVRTLNGQEARSAESATASVQTSRVAPGAPQNLEVRLGSQGVIATWQPPVGPLPASYRLYRAATPTITSVEGLTPLKQNIKVTQAIDAAPSQSEHAYVVTAIDAAGNESALSNSVYLNFSLLPVKTLKVEQVGTALPVLTWSANGQGAVGFDVYVGEGDARIKLTPSPITTTTLTDTGYTGGERHYTVEAVDENAVRIARSVMLPNATTQVVSGLPLKRNVMNRLGVQVSNLSSRELASTRLAVQIGARTFRSEPFSLARNATRVVPVVIGGYPDLPNPAAVVIAIESEPYEGELVRLGWNRQFDVVDSALVVGLDAEGFTRGASGKVRLTVENTSDVEVELLTARNSGRDASDELRLKLFDLDGNPLGTTPYRQATGAGVVTLAGGQTVARIPPGQRYVSDAFVMPVPATSPDQLRLKLEVDRLRHASGQPEEVVIPGMGSERTVVLSDTPYYGEITSADPAVSYGTKDIVMLGHARDRATGAPVPNVPLTLAINQEGFERLADVTTDATGAFRYIFKPTVTDTGTYSIGAIHPDMTDRPAQARFTVNRVAVDPQTFRLTVARNYAYPIEYRASTGTGAQLTGLRIVYAAQYQPGGTLLPGIKVEPPAPIDIAQRQNLAMPVRVSGDNSAVASGRIVLAVFSDGSGSEPLSLLNVDFTLTEAKPALFASPSFVEAGLAQGQTTIEQVILDNKGVVAMSDVTATLLTADGNPAPAWISIASDPALGTIGLGEKRTIDLNIAPTAQVAEGIHPFKLRIAGSNLPAEDINVFVSVTQSGQGNVLFKAADIYTATRDKNGNLIPGMAGARIFVQNEAVISQTYELTTDAFGEAYFQNLPAGSYKFKASAANHQDAAGRFSIKPGITVNQSIFLEYTLISVEWSVREITIEDRYEITLNATFETDVPAPVVVLQPTSINLPKMAPGEVFQGELVLTNYGLIRADNVGSLLPTSDEYFKFEFLVQPPTTLEAKQRVRLPYRIVALRSFGVAPKAGGGDPAGGMAAFDNTASGVQDGFAKSGGAPMGGIAKVSGTPGCFTYSNRYQVVCRYVCANGVESENCGSNARWFYSETYGCPAGGGPSTGGGGWGGPGGGIGGADPGYSTLPGLPLCRKGSGDCDNPGGSDGGGEGGGE